MQRAVRNGGRGDGARAGSQDKQRPGKAQRPRSDFVPLLIGLFFLALYTFTLSPGLLPADAGEYQLTGAVLGVAHPPGFALYTLASWLVSRLPGVAPATAINWLSALLAALTLALVVRVVTALTRQPLAGVGTALLLGFSTTFWAQAVTANIRMPAALATAWMLDRLLAYRASLAEPQPRALAWFALALGLGVSHHGSLIFVAAVLGLYALWLRPAVLRRPWPLLAGLLPFLAWLYFPLRAGAFGAPPSLATLPGFLEHVLARGFSGDIFFFANAAALPERLRLFGAILGFEFVTPVLALMALGALAALWSGRQLGWVLLAAWAIHVFIAMTYRAPQTVEYLMPAWVFMGVWAGLGLSAVWEGARNFALALRAPEWADTALVLILGLFVAAAQFRATYPSYRALARDTSTRDEAAGLLRAAPEGAALLASWHWATPLWYLQQVEGLRPDVDVRYVFPRGASLAQNWVDSIASALTERPVIVTSYYAGAYAALPYRFVPLEQAWEVRAAPLAEAPAGLAGAQSFAAWDFLGYRLDQSGPAEVVVTTAWRSTEPPAPISLFVHLLGPDGTLHSQRDLPYTADQYEPGEVLLDRYVLPLRPDAPAGAYSLVAGVYTPQGDRLAEAALASLSLPPQPFAALPVPAGAAPFGNIIWLTGSTVSPSGRLHPGEAVSVELDFLAARPITADYAVKVDLVGPSWQWRVQSDGTPAGGAIPTLKWIAGSRVRDTHTLTVPAGAAPGTAQVVLALYDSFTGQPLPLLDPALAALGPTLALGQVEIVPPAEAP
ncbi:MAG: DUF2723 domain-containing protein [Anaerolineales bacterium]|nr:DUF2723 domain-containing protein [Anaerolineales bacterium]